ncbi:MAG: SGNH/GDSL hydrolase family protein, partial [Phycisphaerales bacterium]
MTGRQAYLRAGLALAIPAILLLGTQGFDLDSLYAAIVGNQATTLLAVAFLIGLGIIELRCAVVLVRLCRARGNLAAYSATAPTEESLVCRRRWKYRCVVIVLSTVISFGLAELTLRVFDIQPPVPLPNYIQENQSVDNTRNALGIREDWDALSQDDARLRIAFLGDSMTYGYGVEQHESFCHLAEGLLSDDVPGGVVTINLGEPASGPDDHRTLYLSLRDELRPDLVLHVLYLNDLAIDLDPVLRRIYRVRDEDLRFASSSYVLRFAERQVRFWLARQYIREYFRGGANRAEQQAQLARLKAEVRACRRAVEEG